MHPQHFDAAAYSNSLYGPVPGYDTSSIKFQHSGYPVADTDTTSYYSNYVSSSNLQSLQGYGVRDPPGYSDAASFFHPGIVPGFGASSSSAYYKSHSRPSDPSEYPPSTMISRSPESFLLKSPDSVNSCMSPHGYNTNTDSTNSINNTSLPTSQNVSDSNNSNINMIDHQLHNHNHHLLHSASLHQDHLQLPIGYNDENMQTNSLGPSKLNHHELSFFNHNPDMKMESLVKIEPLSSDTNEADNNSKPSPHAMTSCNNSLPISEASVKTVHEKLHNNASANCGSMSSQINDNTSQSTANGETNSSDASNKDNENERKTEENSGANEKKEDGDGKPTMSYIALIAKAILESDQRRLNLGSIYGWIEKHYPFYKTKGQGWRNSVRHNLSLNDCFIKAGRCEDGKGNYWAIHPANIQDFIRGDFRQRRRSRRRGRKKECDLGMYHMTNGYLQPGGTALASQMALNPATLSSIYSPYTEAERRAYRLDEALLRQSMNNPFVKWYQHGVSNPAAFCTSTSPPTCTPGVYANTAGSMQWPQGYPDTSTQTMYPASLNPSFSRQYPSTPVL